MKGSKKNQIIFFTFILLFAGLLVTPTTVMFILPSFPMRFSSEQPLPGRPTARAVSSEEIDAVNYVLNVSAGRNYAVVTSDSFLVEIAQGLLKFRSFNISNNIFVDSSIITEVMNGEVTSAVKAATMTNSSIIFLLFNGWHARVFGFNKVQIDSVSSFLNILGGGCKIFGEQYQVYLMWIIPSKISLHHVEISDLSLSGNNGRIIGNSLIVPGVSGSGLFINGESGCVRTNNSESLNAQKLTLEAWVYLNTNSTYVNPIISKWYGGENPAKDQFILAMYPTLNETYFYLSDGNKIFFVKANTCPTYEWLHVAATYDGQHARIYFNGSLANEMENPSSIASSDTPLFIGSKSPEVEPQYFNGLIDEVRIYNRALSSAEVYYTYKNKKAMLTDGLVLWFSFDI